MPEKLSERDSTALYFVKVFAILASVAAHINIIDTSTPTMQFITSVWDIISCISVPAFFIVGGILYTRKEGDSRSFWKRKGQSIVLPWLFCGILTYGYVTLRVGEGSILELFYWVLGHSSWLYYVTVYLFLLAMFKLIYKHEPLLWLCVAATALQLTLMAKGKGLPSPLDDEGLNPLHWMGFFALGILLRKHWKWMGKPVFAVAAVVLPVMSVVVYRNYIFDYFHILSAVFTGSAFFVLFAIGRVLADTRLKGWIRELGTYTYCIYLLHMQIALPVVRRIPAGVPKAIVAPFIGLAVMVVLIKLGKWITAKIPFGDKIRMLVGLR